MQHQLRPHFLVELFRRQEPKSNRSLLQRRTLLVRLLRTLGHVYRISLSLVRIWKVGHSLLTVIAKVAVQNRRKHERLVQQGVDPFLIRLDANNAVLCERTGT